MSSGPDLSAPDTPTLSPDHTQAGFWARLGHRERLRAGVLSAGLLTGVFLFGAVVHRSYPIQNWLFWVYVKAWAGALAFAAACLCAGNAFLLRVLRRTLPLLEHVSVSFALGLLAFFFEIFIAGILGVLRPWFFFVGPLLLAAPGVMPTWKLGRRAWRHTRPLRHAVRPPRPLLQSVVLVAGCAALALIYFEILTPDNVAYDARWYHLPLAEHYAAQGAIRRLPEGWFLGTYPHLASHFYTWAMLMPGNRYFDRVELCAHMEFVTFLLTLVGISALVRHLVPRARIPLAWVSMFLFPEIFLYDSSLTAGADHFAAFWAPVVLMLFFRTIRNASPVYAGLLAATMAGAISTKLTAIMIVIFPTLGITSWCLWRTLRPGTLPSRGLPLKMLGAAAAAGLVCSAPYWLKNWVWYGDPLFPALRAYFHGHPSTPDFAMPLDNWFYSGDYHPARTLAGLLETVKALITYSFVPNDWPIFHRDVPIFGSLSTLMLLCLPFLPRTQRIWLTYAAIHAGIFVWYSIHHFDRYLQGLLPWMAAALTATMYLLWTQGLVVRGALALLICLQIVWGADVYFFPSHAMAGSSLKKSIDLMSSGYRQDYKAKYEEPFAPYLEIGRKLPHGSKLLIHEGHVHWALQSMSVSDWQGSQAGISYVRAGDLRGVYGLLTGMGVTHLMWEGPASKGYDTLGGDLLFFTFASFLAESPQSFGGDALATMPPGRPSVDMASDVVAFLGCTDTYQDGLYHLSTLVTSDVDPNKSYPLPFRPLARDLPAPEAAKALQQATFAVIDPGCYPHLSLQTKQAGFRQIATRHRLELYARAPVSVVADTRPK